MKNIELKVVIDNPNQVQKILHKIGAKLKEHLYQVDTYFNCKEGRLKTREINHKNFQLIFYNRPNTENSKISDYKIIKLNKQELKEQKSYLEKNKGIKIKVIKKRELWIYKNTRIHLDKVNNLGNFLELETVVKNQKTLQQLIIEHGQIIKLLGLVDYPVIGQSYSDLLLNKKLNGEEVDASLLRHPWSLPV
jgi:predicted adenylyl cyclase CyaB